MPDYIDALPKGARIERFEVVRVLGAGESGYTYLTTELDNPRSSFFTCGAARVLKEYAPPAWSIRGDGGTVGPRSSGVPQYRRGLERFVERGCVTGQARERWQAAPRLVFESGGTAYCVAEYIEGATLSEKSASAGPMDEKQVFAMLEQVMRSLSNVHAEGLSHDDVKPTNVILNTAADQFELVDIGTMPRDAGERLPARGPVASPFMAIEQYSRKRPKGPWTDIYSLGALAYWALTGHLPGLAIDRMAGDSLLSVAEVVPGMDSQFAKAIDLALAVEPDGRPRDLPRWHSTFERVANRYTSSVIKERRAAGLYTQVECGTNRQRAAENSWRGYVPRDRFGSQMGTPLPADLPPLRAIPKLGKTDEFPTGPRWIMHW